MKFNYNGLWKLLIDKNMKKKDLIDRTGISPTTVSKMTKGEAVSLAILGKICEDLGSDIGDLICLDKERQVIWMMEDTKHNKFNALTPEVLKENKQIYKG